MPLKNKILLIVLLITALFNSTGYAKQLTLKPFVLGSYKQIETHFSNQPFVMVVWSITCSSCLKDMALLSRLHKSKPEVSIVMLATDGALANAQVEQVLQKNGLTAIENWNYADENTQKLQFEIDDKWYGELPRTYFFDRSHQRVGVSGVLTETNYLHYIGKILQ